jgi:SAM-dependent methyltransferase
MMGLEMIADTPEQQRHRRHYELEKSLADRLRRARREERKNLYSEVYDELYRSLPEHPGNLQKQNPEIAAASVRSSLRFIEPYLKPNSMFLEVGAGDAALSVSVAANVQKVYAIEVSAEKANKASMPTNMEFVITDGFSIPVPAGSIDVAFSNQVMEHLHPDDAAEQLTNIYRSLKPGAPYICLTPNYLNGPHDVSSYFDEVPTGFHLKEYTTTELAHLFRQVGFRKIGVMLSLKVRVIVVPAGLIRPLEFVLSKLPFRLRNAIGNRQPVEQLLGLRMIGYR